MGCARPTLRVADALAMCRVIENNAHSQIRFLMPAIVSKGDQFDLRQWQTSTGIRARMGRGGKVYSALDPGAASASG